MAERPHLALYSRLRFTPVTPLAAPLLVATGVLVLAGLSKIQRPSATADALRELSIPQPLANARLLGFLEVVLGILAIATGHWLFWLGVGVSYAGFTAFVLWALGDSSRIGSCGCFGREDTPATVGHAVFNATAAALAFVAVTNPVRITDFAGSGLEAVLSVVLIATAIALSIVALTELPRTLMLARGDNPPSIREFSLDRTYNSRGI